LFSNTEANALEIWSAKQKLNEQRTDLRNFISFHYGPSSWKEIVRIEAEQRKQQRTLVYERQEMIDNLINGAIITVLVLTGIGGLALFIYFYGAKQGKW